MVGEGAPLALLIPIAVGKYGVVLNEDSGRDEDVVDAGVGMLVGVEAIERARRSIALSGADVGIFKITICCKNKVGLAPLVNVEVACQYDGRIAGNFFCLV